MANGNCHTEHFDFAQYKLRRSMTREKCLKIPNRLPSTLPRLEIFFVFKNERHEEVDDDGRTNREEGEIDKVHADSCRTDREFFTPPVAHSERAVLEPRCNSVYYFYFSHDL